MCYFSQLRIKRIEKLQNKHLYAAFKIKQHELNLNSTIELIHSTAAENVESIKNNNLDWRRVNRAKYGKGVAFSENADYANYHSSWSGGTCVLFISCPSFTLGCLFEIGGNISELVYLTFFFFLSSGSERAFIICDVLLGSVRNVVDNSDACPQSSYDSYRSTNNYVYVKFDDFTFYPKYAMYYDKPDRSVSAFARKRW